MLYSYTASLYNLESISVTLILHTLIIIFNALINFLPTEEMRLNLRC